MPAGHHHVPQFYQRHFGVDGRVRVFDKSAPALGTVMSVRKAFVSKGDNSWFDDSGTEHDDLETVWSRIEAEIAPTVRRLNTDPTELRLGDADRLATLIANLSARSRAMRSVGTDIIARVTVDGIESAEEDEQLRRGFVNEYGREPRSGEVRAIVAQHAAEFAEEHGHVLDSMVRHHNRIAEMLHGHHVQLVRPLDGLVGFSFGDSPVILQNNDGRVGYLEGLAIGEAQLIFTPIGRHLGVCLTAAPEQPLVELGPSDVVLINRFTWRSAVRFVGAHPNEHPGNVVPDYRAWLESGS